MSSAAASLDAPQQAGAAAAVSCDSAGARSPPSSPSYAVFEFFAGLGGFRLSLPPQLSVHSLTAVEVNHRAAAAYRLNFREAAGGERANKSDVPPAPLQPRKPTHAERRAADRERAARGERRPEDGEQAARRAAQRALGLRVQAEKRAREQANASSSSVASADEGSSDALALVFDEQLAVADEAATQPHEQNGSGANEPATAAEPAAAQPTTEPALSAEPAAATPAAPIDSSSESTSHALSSLCNSVLGELNLPPDALDGGAARDSACPPLSGGSRLWSTLLEHLPPSALVSPHPQLHPSIWLMSPPCQPFTRTVNAKQRGWDDPRNAAIKFIVDALQGMTHDERPAFIFVENVRLFFGSSVHALLWQALRDCGYHVTQYILSPLQCGLPNHRTRFYAAAERRHEQYRQPEAERDLVVTTPPGFEQNGGQAASQPNSAEQFVTEQTGAEVEDDRQEEGADDDEQPESTGAAAATAASSASPASPPSVASSAPSSSKLPSLHLPRVCPIAPLSSFLDPPSWLAEPSRLLSALLVPAWVLAHGWWLSLVSPFDRATHCFTSSYGRIMHAASGSLLLFRGEPVEQQQALALHPLDRSNGLLPYGGSLRFFSPTELLRVFGFPSWYRFPSSFSLRQCYKLIGNSLNVAVVSRIIAHHLLPPQPALEAQAAPSPQA